jgi:hypothetical protein
MGARPHLGFATLSASVDEDTQAPKWGHSPMVGAAPSGDAAVKERRKEMDRSIVCGVDGSPDSQAALAVAIDLATRLQLRLIMANVVEPSHAPYAGAASRGRPAARPLCPATD